MVFLIHQAVDRAAERFPEQEALRCYDRAIDITPFNHNAWYNRGIILNRMGAWRRAIDSYDYALAIDENFASAWYNRGNSCASMKWYEEAID